MDLENITAAQALMLIVAIAVAFGIFYLFIRWAFSIDTRIKQNQSIIGLLSLIAKRQGVTDEEIHSARTH